MDWTQNQIDRAAEWLVDYTYESGPSWASMVETDRELARNEIKEMLAHVHNS